MKQQQTMQNTQPIIQHDEQAVDAEIQDRRAGAVFCTVIDVVAAVAQELSECPSAAHRKAPDDGEAEHDTAEREAERQEAVAQTDVL